MLQIVAGMTLILLGSAALFAWIQNRTETRELKQATVSSRLNTWHKSTSIIASSSGRMLIFKLNSTDSLEWLIERNNRYYTNSIYYQASNPSFRTTRREYQDYKINGNAALLQQAITNLFTNACKYTLSKRRVWVRLISQYHRVLIQIEDTGIGIPEADLPYILSSLGHILL